MQLVQLRTDVTPLEFGHQGLTTSNRGYYLYLTASCNLRCNFCFVSDKDNHEHLYDPISYPKEVGKEDMVGKVINFVVKDPDGRSSKYIHFFGGEPLIRSKSIPRICDGLMEGLPKGFDLKFGITTNGTLLTDDVCQMLLKYKVGVQLSLDGSEEGNDIHRQLMGGDQRSKGLETNTNGGALRKAGAFHLVKIDNYLKYFGQNCRMTVTPQNLPYLSKSIQELTDRGFNSYSIISATDDTDWTDYWDLLESEITKVFDLCHKLKVTCNLTERTFKMIMKPVAVPDHLCQAGRNVIGISVYGDIWPCHDFLGKFSKNPEQVRDLQIGHIDKGYTLNTAKFENVKCDSEIKSGAGYDCKTCHASGICERGCPYINYAGGGSVKLVNANYCKATRMLHDVALRFMVRNGLLVEPTTAPKADHADLHHEVAWKFFQNSAPYGRNSSGQALMPGPGSMRELGIDNTVKAFKDRSAGSSSEPFPAHRLDLSERSASSLDGVASVLHMNPAAILKPEGLEARQ